MSHCIPITQLQAIVKSKEAISVELLEGSVVATTKECIIVGPKRKDNIHFKGLSDSDLVKLQQIIRSNFLKLLPGQKLKIMTIPTESFREYEHYNHDFALN